MPTKERTCPECHAEPGRPHRRGCDIERCALCGAQWGWCGCPPKEVDRLPPVPWSGEWPGKAECRELGWYCVETDRGFRRCGPDEPGASEDLVRLAVEGRWDPGAARWTRP